MLSFWENKFDDVTVSSGWSTIKVGVVILRKTKHFLLLFILLESQRREMEAAISKLLLLVRIPPVKLLGRKSLRERIEETGWHFENSFYYYIIR